MSWTPGTAVKCPFPDCQRATPPDGILCSEHWSMLPSDIRRPLYHEVKSLRARGRRKPYTGPGSVIHQLLEMAFKAIAKNTPHAEQVAAVQEPATTR